MMDDEIQLKAQSCLQEYDDAVENLDPRYAELGRKAVAALDESIAYWSGRPESPQSRAAHTGDATAEEEGEMRRFVERQIEWAQSEKERVLAQLSKEK